MIRLQRFITSGSFLVLKLVLVTSYVYPGRFSAQALPEVYYSNSYSAVTVHNSQKDLDSNLEIPRRDTHWRSVLQVSPDRIFTPKELERLDNLEEGDNPAETDGTMRRVAPFSAQQWHYAHATFYGDETARETMQGACGYGNLYQQGYGTATTALSTTLFNKGFACGSCFEIRCMDSSACNEGSPSTIVTATNFCPANWQRPTNNGGWCNPPRQHFDMSRPAFDKIAYWRAGIVPIAYRRVPCMKQGNMQFMIKGNPWWHIVFITNVGGPGDIGQVYIRGSNTRHWVQMTHNWGVGYHIFRRYLGQGISFMVISNSNLETVMAWNVAPGNWQLGQSFSGGQFQRPR